MNKCKIMITRSNRSDFGLVDPIIKRLNEDPLFDVVVLGIVPSSFRGGYAVAKNAVMMYKPDMFLVVGDRIEATGATAGVFHTRIDKKKVIIVHYGAGITNTPITTVDDVNRHIITFWSDIMLCEDIASAKKTLNLLRGIYKVTKWKIDKNGPEVIEGCPIHIVGVTLHDDLILDYSSCPKVPFDMILYNPPTMYDEDILSLLPGLDKKTLWIQSNADPTNINYYEIVRQQYPNHIKYWFNQPRPIFLGLMDRCERYITNSSSIKYEAPLFKNPEQIIPIGDRNILRSTPEVKTEGASDKIVEILKDEWIKCQK